MRTWYTTRVCEPTRRSQISHIVVDSGWEKYGALEVKGEDSAQEHVKRAALRQWLEAVNAHGGFGAWAFDVGIAAPSQARDVIDRHGA